MKLHLSPRIQIFLVVSLVLALFSPAAQASIDDEENHEGMVEVYNPDALVEMHVPQDALASYKSRRGNHGAYFGIEYENYTPISFVSINDGKTYNELFNGEPLPIISAMFDYKFNFSLGSVALGLSAGMGSISDNRSGSDRSLDITKYMASFKYTMDNLFDEPYVAPYVGMSMYQMSITDKSPTSSISETPPLGYAYTLGLLLQLDWLDYDTAKNATFNYGLQNTFIDVFMTQYLASGGEADANMESDPIWGVGLRMEF